MFEKLFKGKKKIKDAPSREDRLRPGESIKGDNEADEEFTILGGDTLTPEELKHLGIFVDEPGEG